MSDSTAATPSFRGEGDDRKSFMIERSSQSLCEEIELFMKNQPMSVRTTESEFFSEAQCGPLCPVDGRHRILGRDGCATGRRQSGAVQLRTQSATRFADE